MMDTGIKFRYDGEKMDTRIESGYDKRKGMDTGMTEVGVMQK